MRQLSCNLPDEVFERIQTLLAYRIKQEPLKQHDRTEVVIDTLTVGLKVIEAQSYSGITLLVEKKI